MSVSEDLDLYRVIESEISVDFGGLETLHALSDECD